MLQIFEKIQGTRTFETLSSLDEIYSHIDSIQSEWKQHSTVNCPDGCGECCVAFEPDVLEAEALYLAAWLTENDSEKAKQIMTGDFPMQRKDNKDGCFLFNPDNPYHCTVYGGRCLICRLFGYSGDRGKDNEIRWKPCRFLPEKKLAAHSPALTHRQYEKEELEHLFGALPPAMSDIMEQAVSLSPDSAGDTRPLREALPAALKKIQFILLYCSGTNPDNGDQPASA